jgi:hypothetical protein
MPDQWHGPAIRQLRRDGPGLKAGQMFPPSPFPLDEQGFSINERNHHRLFLLPAETWDASRDCFDLIADHIESALDLVAITRDGRRPTPPFETKLLKEHIQSLEVWSDFGGLTRDPYASYITARDAIPVYPNVQFALVWVAVNLSVELSLEIRRTLENLVTELKSKIAKYDAVLEAWLMTAPDDNARHHWNLGRAGWLDTPGDVNKLPMEIFRAIVVACRYFRCLSTAIRSRTHSTSPTQVEVEQTHTLSPKRWFEQPPEHESKFRHGPVEGTLANLSEWLGIDARTLKIRNGKGDFYIQEVHKKLYRIWLVSQRRYAELNQKALAVAANLETRRPKPTRRSAVSPKNASKRRQPHKTS